MNIADRMHALCTEFLRQPFSSRDTGADPVLVFEPPLSPAEQTVYDRLLRIATSAVQGITPEEWLALENDIAGLVTYQSLPTPTLAQTVLAVKAQSRILRAMLRS